MSAFLIGRLALCRLGGDVLKRYTYKIASTEFSAKIELQSESDG